MQHPLHPGTWDALSPVLIFALSTSVGLPLRLASWMQSIRSKFDLGFVLDLLHLDDHEFSGQVVARLSKSEDQTSIALSSAQVKDLVLNNMVITLGARKTVNWLSTIARRVLRPLPLKALTVLIHAFLPQLTYEGETAIEINLLSAEHPWMEWKSQPPPLHVDMSFFMSFGSSFRPQRPPLHFGSLVMTPLTLLSNGMSPPGALSS